MFKASIVGCGKIAGIVSLNDNGTHGEAVLASKKIKLISCYDIDKSKSKVFSKKYKCAIETTIGDIVNISQPDIICICTPDHTHFDIVTQILINPQNTRLIFLEKPICNKENDYKKLLKIAQKSSVKIVVNHSRRFDLNHQWLKKKIKNNEFGKLIECNASYYSGWIHNGTHIIDTLNYLFDDDFKLKKIFSVKKSKYMNDPSIDMEIKFKKINSAIRLSTFDEHFYQLLEMELRFEKNRIRFEDFGKKIIFEKKMTNNIKENILKNYEISKKVKYLSPMENAFINIEKYLLTNNLKYINDYTIENSLIPMNFLWKTLRASAKV